MLKPMFCVYDSKARVFANPFISVNNETAIRDFQRACTDPQSDLMRFPSDYTLYKIGAYDDSNAMLSPITPPEFICTAQQFQEV